MIVCYLEPDWGFGNLPQLREWPWLCLLNRAAAALLYQGTSTALAASVSMERFSFSHICKYSLSHLCHGVQAVGLCFKNALHAVYCIIHIKMSLFCLWRPSSYYYSGYYAGKKSAWWKPISITHILLRNAYLTWRRAHRRSFAFIVLSVFKRHATADKYVRTKRVMCSATYFVNGVATDFSSASVIT